MKKTFSELLGFIKRNKIMTRLLSFALSVLMVFYVIPSVIYAEIADAIEGISVLGNFNSQDEPGYVADEYEGILYEAVELREESVKHFHSEDGRYIAAQYSYPVHYYENGEFRDIDNTLGEIGGVYTSPDARIKFNKHITGNGSLFTLHEGNTKITLSLIGAKKGVVGEATNNTDDGIDTELGKQLNLEKLSSDVIYRDILDGVDLEYVVHSLNVKENIIVKERLDSYTFDFEMKLNGLTAELDESGNVILREGGELRYTIPAPTVFDANGHEPDEDMAYYILIDNGNGKYRLTVLVSPEWMNSEERAYPVVVDPAIYQRNASAVDTYISSLAPATNYYGATQLSVSQGDYILWKLRELPALPSDAHIVSANLTYLVDQARSSQSIGAYIILDSWNHQTVSYQNVTNGNLSFISSPFDLVTAKPNSEKLSWDITFVAREWYSGALANNGIALIGNMPNTNTNIYYKLKTIRNSLYNTTPSFSIAYTHTSGIESYYPMITQDTGISGSGALNLATGALTFIVPTVSTTDYLFADNPALIYNSTNEEADTHAYMPSGFDLSINESIRDFVYYTSPTQSSTRYRYRDSDGTNHDFINEKSTTVFTDEDALGYELTILSGGIVLYDTNTRYHKLFLKSSDSGPWLLSVIADPNGNTMRVNRDSQGKPTSVGIQPQGLPEVEHVRFLYNDDGKLTAIYHVSSKEGVAIPTDSEGRLNYIFRARGNENTQDESWLELSSFNFNAENITCDFVCFYHYNADGYLISAKNSMSPIGINYTVSGGKIISISEMADSVGQTIKISYAKNLTEITTSGEDDVIDTSDDISTYYVFDGYGRAVSTYSMDKSGALIYGAVSGEYETKPAAKNSIKSTVTLGGSFANYILDGDFEKDESISPWTFVNAERIIPLEQLDTVWVDLQPAQYLPSYISQYVKLGAGTYTLSMKLNTLKVSGVDIGVVVTSADGSEIIHSDIMPNTELESFSTCFTLSSTMTVEIKIMACYKDSSFDPDNTVNVADVMLEKGNTPSPFNMIEYGSFEASGVNASGSITTPVSSVWAGATVSTSSAPFGKVLSMPKYAGTHIVKQVVYQAPDNYLDTYGTAAFSKNAGNKYVLSGFAYTSHATPAGEFRLYAEVVYHRGDEGDVTKTFVIDFQDDVAGFQFGSVLVDTNQYYEMVNQYGDITITTYHPYTCIKSISVVCEYSRQSYSNAFFDNISFIDASEVTEENVYSDEGLLIARKSAYYTEYTHYVNRIPVAVFDTRLNMTENTFDNSGNLINSIQYRINNMDALTHTMNTKAQISDYLENLYVGDKKPQSETNYFYDDYGLLTDVNSYQLGNDYLTIPGSPKLSQTYSYDTDPASKIFGALLTENVEGEGGYRYFYDGDNGRLLAKFDTESGDGVAYTYDGMGRMIGVKPAYVSSATTGYTTESGAESVAYAYNNYGYLDSITTDSTTYSFVYDSFGNAVSTDIGDTSLATYVYNDYNGKLNRVIYGNGFSVIYDYNAIENVEKVWYNYSEDGEPVLAYSYEYTSNGDISILRNHIEGYGELYRYDSFHRLVDIYRYNLDNEYDLFNVSTLYDAAGRVGSQRVNLTVGSTQFWESIGYGYSYNENGSIKKLTVSGDVSSAVNYTYDKFGRITNKRYGEFVNTTISYVTDSNMYSGARIGAISQVIGEGDNATVSNYTYAYDENGNIISVGGNQNVLYRYDNLGQLVREDNGTLNTTFLYTYDNAGNITRIASYYYYPTADDDELTLKSVVNLGYNNAEWGDQLTSYGANGITYDEIGNPLSYYNGKRYYFTWEGRQLSGASFADGGIQYNLSYTYDADGLRLTKTVNNALTKYYYVGGILLGEEDMDGVTLYLYDAEGSPIGMQYHSNYTPDGVWETYIYEKNLQGDIVSVYTADGTKLITYYYDAWGNTSALYSNNGESTNAAKNNLTYRGYYYDRDTGLYYLKSRYYDPTVKRWISPDVTAVLVSSPDSLAQKNLYAYCDNNPVSYVDNSGEFPFHILIGAAIGAVVGGVSAALSGEDTAGIVIGVFAGALSGALTASGVGVVGQVLGSAGIAMASNAATQIKNIVLDESGETQFDAVDMIFDGVVAGAMAVLGGDGASYGNTAGINSSWNRLFKRGIFDPKAQSYFYKTAHNCNFIKDNRFVLKSLGISSAINSAGSVIIFVKNLIKGSLK